MKKRKNMTFILLVIILSGAALAVFLDSRTHKEENTALGTHVEYVSKGSDLAALKALNDEANVFKFTLTGAYQSVTVWKDTYRNGVLEKAHEIELKSNISSSGKIMITDSEIDGVGINVNVGITSGKNTARLQFMNPIEMESYEGGRVVNGLNQLAPVELEQPIPFIAYQYFRTTTGKSLSKAFFENPKKHLKDLQGTDLAYIYQAQFSTEKIKDK